MNKTELMYLRISVVNGKILQRWFDLFHPLPIMKGDKTWYTFYR